MSSAYNIDPVNGQLSPIAASFAPSPQALAMDPAGRFLFATYASNRVIAYRIGATGTLSEAGNAATGAAPKGVAVARDGRYLFVSMYEGSGNNNRLYVADLVDGKSPNVKAPAATKSSPFVFVSVRSAPSLLER